MSSAKISEECKTRDKYRLQIKATQKHLDFFKLECDRQNNKIIKSYFGNLKGTIKALLNALYNLVKSKSETY
jgi:hypothetical protein